MPSCRRQSRYDLEQENQKKEWEKFPEILTFIPCHRERDKILKAGLLITIKRK